MTPISIIIAALSIMSGNPDRVEPNEILGKNLNEVLVKVERLEGSRLSKIKNTIDILAKYDLGIKAGNTLIVENSDSQGVSYSTDPEEQPVIG